MAVYHDLAARQDGLVALWQLRKAGTSARTVDRLVQRGSLERVCRGILKVPGWPPSWMQGVWMAWLRAGEGAVVSHRTAAAIHGLDGFTTPDLVGLPGPIDLSVPPSRRLRGKAIHHAGDLGSDVIWTPKGLPLTGVLRTLGDVGAVVDANRVERGAECALRRKDVTVAQLHGTAGRLRRRGRRGPVVLLQVLGRRAPGVPPTGSDLETCLLQLTRTAGLPDPQRQVAIRVGNRVIFLDFGWPSVRLALEADGAETHATPKALVDDLRRQNHIVQGWVILRFSWEDVHRFPDQVCQVLRETWLLLQTGPVPRQVAGWR